MLVAGVEQVIRGAQRKMVSQPRREFAFTVGAGNSPTPLDPYPEPRPQGGSSRTTRPIELGADAISILEGRTFMFSDSVGDVRPGSTGGLVHEDTRFLSAVGAEAWGAPTVAVKSTTSTYNSTARSSLRIPTFAFTRAKQSGGSANAGSRSRRARAAHGVQHGGGGDPSSCGLVCRDFADLFEVRSSVARSECASRPAFRR